MKMIKAISRYYVKHTTSEGRCQLVFVHANAVEAIVRHAAPVEGLE